MHLPQSLAMHMFRADHKLQTLTAIDFQDIDCPETQRTPAFQRYRVAQMPSTIGFQRFICAVTQCSCDSFPFYDKGYIPTMIFPSYFIDILRLPKKTLQIFHLLKCPCLLTFLPNCRFILKIFLNFSCMTEFHVHIFASPNNNKTTFT